MSARQRRAAAVALLAAGAALAPAALHAQAVSGSPALELRDAGPDDAARLLRAVLARPYHTILPDADTLRLPRDSAIATTIVVVGATVTVASNVAGDVVVVGGDLHVHPGAHIRGRAVAFGGGVYGSTLATVDSGIVAFRDLTYEPIITETGIALAHVSLIEPSTPAVAVVWPGLYGLRIPDYTRVDGLVLPVGPRLELLDGRLSLDVVATYRSHLGELDPGLDARYALDERTEVELSGERGTYTNDTWARFQPVNAGTTLAFGRDLRNYYRATRFGAAVKRRWESFAGFVEPWVGVQTEDAWSVGPVPGTTSHPWTIANRGDTTRILRPNPQIDDGRITSALLGGTGEWVADDGMTVRGRARLELAVDAPDERRFAQLTLDAGTQFTTVRDHWLELGLHVVTTAGDPAPAQRFAYLGGSSTIPTMDVLSMGGDQLVFVEGSYMVPLPRPVIPMLGAPSVGVRYIVGSAGVDRLPKFVQNVGLRLAVSMIRLDFMVDPASGESDVGFGVYFP